MSDICLIMRVGNPPDHVVRKTLFAMAQYMIESRLETLSFDVETIQLITTMSTEFRRGSHNSVSGFIFRANLAFIGTGNTEMLFLVDRAPNWKDDHIEKWEWNIGGDAKTNWKN